MKTYSKDPYWTYSRYDCTAEDGTPVLRGDRIFYYPNGRKVFVGAAAEAAAADFIACAQDEAFVNGETY